MKISTTISFIILTVLICLTRTTLTAKCVIYSKPIYRGKTEIIDCPTTNGNNNKRTLDKRQSATSTDMFIVDFHCSISNTTLCNKVKSVFVSAGEYVTATLNLKKPITVNAQFLDFCQQEGDCGTTEIILGAARPTMMIPNQDSDGKTRLYPQALYKQLNFPQQGIQMGSSDITAMFNSNMNYFFSGDPLPMQENQVDMLYVVIHELTHGLGFTNSWNQYINNLQVLTPDIGEITNDQGTGSQTEFFEFIFDKNLVLLPSGTPLSSITDQLNQFHSSGSEQNFISSFEQSPQFQIAQSIYNNGTKHGSIGFVLTPGIPNNNPNLSPDNVFLLETTLTPFEPSSSIGHVDLQTYLNSSDFLMMFTYPPGETLDNMMSRAGSTSTTGPMGPQLRKLFGILGYDVKTTYTPPNPSNIDSGTVVNSSNSFLDSFNLVLPLVCILFTFINYLN